MEKKLIIEKCWSKNPNERPNFVEIFNIMEIKKENQELRSQVLLLEQQIQKLTKIVESIALSKVKENEKGKLNRPSKRIVKIPTKIDIDESSEELSAKKKLINIKTKVGEKSSSEELPAKKKPINKKAKFDEEEPSEKYHFKLNPINKKAKVDEESSEELSAKKKQINRN